MIRVVEMLVSMEEIREREELVMDIAAELRTFLTRSENTENFMIDQQSRHKKQPQNFTVTTNKKSSNATSQ